MNSTGKERNGGVQLCHKMGGKWRWMHFYPIALDPPNNCIIYGIDEGQIRISLHSDGVIVLSSNSCFRAFSYALFVRFCLSPTYVDFSSFISDVPFVYFISHNLVLSFLSIFLVVTRSHSILYAHETFFTMEWIPANSIQACCVALSYITSTAIALIRRLSRVWTAESGLRRVYHRLQIQRSPIHDVATKISVHGCTQSVIAYYTHQNPVYYTLPGVRLLRSSQFVRGLQYAQDDKKKKF
jgi:hypothetical protein